MTIVGTAIIVLSVCRRNDHAIVSCRSARTRHGHRPSPAKARLLSRVPFAPAHVVLLPCVDVLGSAPARRSHGSPSADFLTKKTNKSTLLKKIDVCRSRRMINTIMTAHAATYST
ncbi:unnamed protein product, partial [Iphiclides podalirius]